MALLLAGDIGGTKTLLAFYRTVGDQLELLVSRRYASSEWTDLAPMVCRFLEEAHPPGLGPPQAACFAVAGPVQSGRATLTNLPWQLDASRLRAETGIDRLELVNDFAVLIYGLPSLSSDQCAVVRAGEALQDQPMLVLGAGTGLGVAYGIPTPAGVVSVASEASHGEFAPRDAAEWRLKQWLRAQLGLERVSIERVVSGPGLGLIARWLISERQAEEGHPLLQLTQDLPSAVAMAAAKGDPLAREAMDRWLSAYGSVSGDLALAGLCRGGVWLAGGTAGKLLGELRGEAFLRGFQTKGRLSPVLERLPITAVTDAAVGQFSAACRARMICSSPDR